MKQDRMSSAPAKNTDPAKIFDHRFNAAAEKLTAIKSAITEMIKGAKEWVHDQIYIKDKAADEGHYRYKDCGYEPGDPICPQGLFRGPTIPKGLMRYPHLSWESKGIWCYLAERAGNNGLCYPSLGTIARDCGCGISLSGVRACIAELERKRFIVVLKGDRKNDVHYYVLIWHPCLSHDIEDIAPPKPPKSKPAQTDTDVTFETDTDVTFETDISGCSKTTYPFVQKQHPGVLKNDTGYVQKQQDGMFKNTNQYPNTESPQLTSPIESPQDNVHSTRAFARVREGSALDETERETIEAKDQTQAASERPEGEPDRPSQSSAASGEAVDNAYPIEEGAGGSTAGRGEIAPGGAIVKVRPPFAAIPFFPVGVMERTWPEFSRIIGKARRKG